MKIIITAFTKQGITLATTLCNALGADLYLPSRLSDGAGYETVDDFARIGFSAYDALVFVGACGIAVRAIAPYIKDKFTDPAVITVDEMGQFMIPLLSGHVGGANKLAQQIATQTGGRAVISTATDLNRCFSVDMWAKEQNLAILDRGMAKTISAQLLEGNRVGFSSCFPYEGGLPTGLVGDGTQSIGICVSHSGEKPYQNTLPLVPKSLVLGIGCRRGTGEETIFNRVTAVLAQHQLAWEGITAVCTIDRKGDEIGLLDFCNTHRLPLSCYTAEELQGVAGEFTPSQFVKDTVGVDNVCERSACFGGNRLLVSKQGGDGVTVAVATRPVCIRFLKGDCL